MPGQIFRFDPPTRFVAGTVGEPGQRTFFLQARDDQRLTSVALEKDQVSALVERIDALLDEVVRRTGGSASIPAITPAEVEDLDPLEEPIVEEFRVGTLTLTWDSDDELIVIEAYAQTEGDDEPPDDPENSDREVLLVRISGTVARTFVKRATAVVEAGRPPCPLCSLPLDPEGHICPRQNGYRRRL
ncbi:MAG TPA: DUF3090 domain-containing protein [Jiangellaceae bacterium]|nr:DUF3090 domain-containing protein [Jiangellaceae bacterium]